MVFAMGRKAQARADLGGLYCPPQIPAGIPWILVHSGDSRGMEFWQWCLPNYYVILAECRPGMSIPPEFSQNNQNGMAPGIDWNGIW